MKLNSPFSNKLHTNYVPTVPEIEEIRQLIAQPLEARSILDLRIARFKAILDDMCRQRSEVDVFIKAHLPLVSGSGARRLPYDVLQEIFFHCLPTDRNAVMSITEAPLLLTQICSSWRKMSMTMPCLWSTLHAPIPIYYHSGRHDKLVGYLEAMRRWLDLSFNRPISLSVECRLSSGKALDSDAANHLFDFMSLFFKYSHRWERIDFALPLNQEVVECLSSLTKNDVPMLKSLTLESSILDFYGARDTDSWPSIRILDAPSLREISLLRYTYHQHFIPHVSHWRQLTGLSMESDTNPWNTHGIDTASALSIFAQCPNLVACRIKVDIVQRLNLSPPERSISMKHLRSFVFIEGAMALGAHFLNFLDLPVLQHLGYRRYNNSSRIACLSIRTLFSRENVIDDLELDFESVAPEALRDCLSVASSIKRLTLHGLNRKWSCPPGDSLNDTFLALLTPQGKGCLCPCLEEINLNFCRDVTDEAILTFLQQRSSSEAYGIARLRTASFTPNRHMADDILPHVQPLIALGLRFQLKYEPPIAETDCKPSGLPDPYRLCDSSITLNGEFSPWRGTRRFKKIDELY